MYWLSIVDQQITPDQRKELLEKSAELGYWRARSKLQLRDPSRKFSDINSKESKIIDIPKWIHQDFNVIYIRAQDLYTRKLKERLENLSDDNLFIIRSEEDRIMVDLFKTAALGGNSRAQHWLGRFYEKNNPEQSERWFFHAAYNKNREAYESVGYIQSKKFFTKEKLEMKNNLGPFSYHDPQALKEDKKIYARSSYFWGKLADDHTILKYGLSFYERWPIDRIVRDCKTPKVNSTESCVENYRYGVLS